MDLVQWHWLVFALVLIGLEALGTGGFLVGAAIAAFFMAIIVHFTEVMWEWQIIYFAVMSLIATTIFWLFFKRSDQKEHSLLNNRAAQIVGKTFTLEKDISAPQDRVQIGDTFWKVQVSTDLPAGTKVRVSETEGMCLTIVEI